MYITEEYLFNEVGLIFSRNHNYYNFNNWVNSKNGNLYIVGFSGAGKTTLGKQLSEKYNVKLKILDDMYKEIFVKLYGEDELKKNEKYAICKDDECEKRRRDTFNSLID